VTKLVSNDKLDRLKHQNFSFHIAQTILFFIRD